MSSRIHISAAAALAVAVCLVWPFNALAQMSDEDDPQRIERLENQVRQLTGQNEELQYRNRQLEEQLRQLQATLGQQASPGTGVPPRGPAAPPVVATNPPAPPAAPSPQYPQPQYQPPSAPAPTAVPAPIDQPQASPRGGRRNDAFDPTQNPNAPGAPRPLGGGAMPIDPNAPVAPPIGAPGGRGAGEPLDLANTSPRRPGATDQGATLTTLPPAATPRDEYDLGVGYLERKDYALAEETMRNFIQKYPSDRLVAEAQYWLGEAMFQRQRYRDAAEAYLTVTTKYTASAKAPDALLRLGQSLAALKEKEAACAALGEVARKYPHASAAVKQGVDREQKRVKC
ncbi:MAG: tol-pal system protein YbgF [Xanthobacteraceae bacterium]|nr:tol-pal system protein YbgF [Xanthobacteraceae bacterium]